MAEKRKRLFARLLRLIFVFALGVAAGYYARDRRQAGEIQEAVVRVRQEMTRAGLEAIERGRRAGEGIGAGARVAADSASAAFRELVGDTAGRGPQP